MSHIDKLKTPVNTKQYQKNLAQIDFSKSLWKNPEPRAEVPRTAYIQPDYADYVSPVSEKVISGKRQRREDMKAHDAIDARDFPSRSDNEKWRKPRDEQ